MIEADPRIGLRVRLPIEDMPERPLFVRAVREDAMPTDTATDEGVVFKSEDDAILLKDSKGEPWKHYLKYGKNYDSYKPEVGQKVRVQYRPWENPSTGKVSYYLNEVEVLGPPPETTPAGPSSTEPGPAPVYSYDATHDAAQARANPGNEDIPPGGVAANSYEPGTFPYRDLSIQRQNRLNVAVQALVANLEHCPPEDKANRMITPWTIAEFERLLVDGAATPS